MREGDDLRGVLASQPREQQIKARMIAAASTGGKATITLLAPVTVVLAGILLMPIARADQKAVPQTSVESASDRQAQVQKLRRALDEESQRAIYRWHDAEHPSQPTWLDKQLDKIGKAITRAWNAIGNFLRKLLPRNFNLAPDGKGSGRWQWKEIRIWLLLIVIATLLGGALLIWLRRRRQPVPLSIPMEVAPLPDLGESAIASAHSEDEWFALASRLQKEGELRLAVRAAYLGLLAGLGQRQWLSIRRDRTNREYLDEFVRRWRRRPQAAIDARGEVPERLRGSLRHFDGVWYGSYEVTADSVAAYQRDQQELLSHV